MKLVVLLVALMVPEFSDSGVPQREVAELVKLYRTAQLRLRETVRNPLGQTEGGRAFRQARAAQLLEQVDGTLAELGQRRGLWVGRNAPQAYRDGQVRGDQQAREAGVRPPEGPLEGSFAVIDREAVRVFARDISIDLAKAEGSMGEQARRVLRVTAQTDLAEADIDRVLAGGLIEGTPVGTIRQLREDLRAVAGDTITIVNKSGNPMTFDVGKYAALVVKTKTRQATVVARHNRLQAAGLDLVSVIGALSGNFCTAYLGKVFSLSGSHPTYPSIRTLPGGGPPFHPNCTKSTRPFIAELATDRQLDNAAGVEDADQLLNVDAATAQRRFKDLQLKQQVAGAYAASKEL